VSREQAEGLRHLAVARRRAQQLQEALIGLLGAVEDSHPSWLELARDAECIERRLARTMCAMEEILRQDPSSYLLRYA
jgi:AraC-like DNA-binding protein